MLMTTQMVFGWAKPMPVNDRALKHPKYDMAWVAIAGPASNVLMAIAWLCVGRFLAPLLPAMAAQHLAQMAMAGLHLNVILAALNSLPIPPLDGSRVLSCFLPPSLAYTFERIEPYGLWIIVGLLMSGILPALISPLYGLIMQLMNVLVH